MARWNSSRGVGRRSATLLGVAVTASFALAACGGSSSGGASTSGTDAAGGSSDKIAVSLITKDSTNPFFVAMQDGAKKAGAANGVDVTIASGKAEGDDARPDRRDRERHRDQAEGHPHHPDVHRRQRRDQEGPRRRSLRHRPRHPAGPAGHRRHHLRHRQPRGRRAHRQVDRRASSTARRPRSRCSTSSTTRSSRSTTTVTRASSRAWASRSATRRRTATSPRPASTPVARAATTRSSATRPPAPTRRAARRAWRTCLAKNPDINVVYTINEPTAAGAAAAMKAAGKTGERLHRGVGRRRQAPASRTSRTASSHATVAAVPAEDGRPRRQGDRRLRPQRRPSRRSAPGLDFFNTGVTLIAKDAVAGVESKDPAYGLENAWG